MEKHKCPLCGSTKARLLLSEDPYRILLCESCAFTFATGDHPLNNGDRYDENYYHRYSMLENRGKRAYFRKLARRITEITDQKDLLEVGFGTGDFLVEARDAGFSVTGLETSPWAISFVKDRHGIMNVHKGFLDHPALADRTFGIILCHHVLEHIEDPLLFLSQTKELLSDDGLLVIEVPDEFHQCVSMLRSFFGSWKPITPPPEHFSFYNEDTLVRLLDVAGFEVVEMKKVGHLEKGLMNIGRNWYRSLAGAAMALFFEIFFDSYSALAVFARKKMSM